MLQHHKLNKVNRRDLWITILKLKLYFVNKGNHKRNFSTYYLLGFRGKYSVLNPVSLVDNLTRLRLFLKLCRRSKFVFWVMGFDSREVNAVRWLAWVVNAPYLLFLARRGVLVVCSRKYLWLRHRFITYRVLQFIGVDALLIPFYKYAEGFLGTMQSRGLPVISINSEINRDLVTYTLLANTDKRWEQVFYIRLLGLFFQ